MNNFENHRTLILNATYQPLSIASAKRSVSLLLSNKINVIKNSNFEIRSESSTITIPKVAALNYYVKAPYARRVALNRENIFIRDKYICQYCGNQAESIDHIIPKSKGGEDSWENLIIACSPCNSRKGNRSLIETKMKLMKVPKKPNRFMYFNQYINQKNQGWKEYLFQNKN